jgi:thioredoxin reductase (NADPH)
MAVIADLHVERARIEAAFGDASRIVVVALCAAWCDTCNEFRAAYEKLAERRGGATFAWLDIEDDAELVGDIDVENFPTLAIYRGSLPLHFGVSLPHASSIERLIDALAEGAGATATPEAVRDLPQRLLAEREGRTRTPRATSNVVAPGRPRS